MNKTSRNFLLISIAIVLCLGAWFLFFRSSLDKPNPNLQIDDQTTPQFFIDQIDNVSIHVLDEVYNYKRSSKHKWPSIIVEKKLNQIFSLLALMHKQTIEHQQSTLWSVSMTVDGTPWSGQWDGNSFKWTDGPLMGTGAVLSHSDFGSIFLEGRFTFKEDSFTWCNQRPVALRFSDNSNNLWVIYNNKAHWYKQLNDKKIDTFDGTYTEKWLGKFCNIKVKRFIDVKFLPADLIWQNMTVQFKDKSTQVILFEKDKNFVLFKPSSEEDLEPIIIEDSDFIQSLDPFMDASVDQK